MQPVCIYQPLSPFSSITTEAEVTTVTLEKCKSKSTGVQTCPEEFEEQKERKEEKAISNEPSAAAIVVSRSDQIKIPLSIVTLQSILIAARSKAASKIPPKQFTIYQLSNDIMLLLQESLGCERNAYNFVGLPLKNVAGHQIDRMAWWFYIISRLVEDFNPSPGHILPSLKMLRQEISSLADVAVEIISVQKMIQKQLQHMADCLYKLFSRCGDLFGSKEWDHKLSDMRDQDTAVFQETFEKWLEQSECIKLTAFEAKTLVVQHEKNKFQAQSLNKLSLKCRREFIKTCLDHLNSVLKKSCVASQKAHGELRKTEKEIKAGIDRLVQKLDNLRTSRRFRQSNCAPLLKTSLHSLGLCLYEFIDIVRFIIKLGRFVLLASEHVLRFANRWSHFCDVTYLSQLDIILEELSESKKFSFLRCFKPKEDRKEKKREVMMSAFDEYFQHWIKSKVEQVTETVTLPMSTETVSLIFNDEEQLSISLNLDQKSGDKVMADAEVISLHDLQSSRELDVVTLIAKMSRASNVSVIETELSTARKLEEIGIKLL